MNGKLSMWKLLFSVASVGLLVTNCTLKTDTDADTDTGCTEGHKKTGCNCPDQSEGYQVCKDDGTYAACQCTGANVGGSSSVGGASASAGAPSSAGKGGAVSYAGTAGQSSEAGAGGDNGLNIDPADCGTCLATLCMPEWAACEAENETTVLTPGDDYCLSQGTKAAPGQIELILDCITTERSKGVVKRDVVRACGSSIGASPDPMAFVWAPPEMTPATEALMNCMADAADETTPGDWANDQTNYPAAGPLPWDDMTCAKLACTSKLP